MDSSSPSMTPNASSGAVENALNRYSPHLHRTKVMASKPSLSEHLPQVTQVAVPSGY
jgi:hypothetical protein